jgi:hypothetical protein
MTRLPIQSSDLSSLFDKYKSLWPTMEKAIYDVYEKEGIDPIELAVFFNLMCGLQINKVVQEYLNLTQEQINEVGSTMLRQWITEGRLPQLTAHEIIGLNKILGVSLVKFDKIIKDLHRE